MKPLVGVLAAQGAFSLHSDILRQLGADVIEIRGPEHLSALNALVLPGGESTVMGKILERWELLLQMRSLIANGLPVMGVCAGLILLADRTEKPRRSAGLGGLNISVERNAYGRQIDSFETSIDIEAPRKGSPPIKNYRAVFIRAPLIREVSKNVQVLARFENHPVLVRQGCITGTSFHPELSGTFEIHEWLLKEAVKNSAQQSFS